MAKAPQTLNSSRFGKNLPEAEASTFAAVQKHAAVLQKKGGEAFVVTKDKVVKVAGATKAFTLEIATDRRAQVTAASAAAGGATIGTGGAAVGLVAGGALGAAIGILPALLTFGLSIPVGAVLGGGCGVIVGGATGTTVGLTAGGSVGFGAYTKRVEIKKAIVVLRSRISNFARKSKEVPVYLFAMGYATVNNKAAAIKRRMGPVLKTIKQKADLHLGAAAKKAVASAAAAKSKIREVSSQRVVQVTAASTTGGAVIGGTGGAATGLLAGGALGAAIGVVPAIFTFGLSIPVGAVIGGGCGLATGTAVGSTAGAVVGGVGGYGVFTKREVIGTTMGKTSAYVKRTASHSAGYVRAKLSGTTGGTA